MLDDFAFGVAGSGCLAEPAGCTIAFVRAQQVTGKLGRLTKANRQHSGSERIEAAAMPGLTRAKQSTHLLQGMIRADADRFIEDQDTVDITVIPGIAGRH
jgi:hypothetical protein